MARCTPALVAGLFGLGAAARADLSVTFVDSAPLPASALDQHGQAFSITGLSGITLIAVGDATHRFVGVMDNADKLVFINVIFDAQGTIAGVTADEGLTLAESGDHEGIACVSFDTVLVSDEAASTLKLFSLADGSLLGTASAPAIYSTRRANLGLESLSIDAGVVWAANEEALSGDGSRATPSAGTTVRLLRQHYDTAAPIAQHAYEVEPMHGPTIPAGNPGQSGLSELVALPDGSVLALERSLALASPLFLSRIYEIDTSAATDVSGLASLDGTSYTPVGKTLLYQGGHENLEGLCLGPQLPDGYALVGVVDDGDPLSTNRLVVFKLTGLTKCAADLNRDGALNGLDVGLFLQSYSSHHPRADLNRDGLYNGLDVSLFLSAYSAGC